MFVLITQRKLFRTAERRICTIQRLVELTYFLFHNVIIFRVRDFKSLLRSRVQASKLQIQFSRQSFLPIQVKLQTFAFLICV